MNSDKRVKLIEKANENLRVFNEHYEYIDSIIRGAEEPLNTINKKISEITQGLAKHHFVYQLIHPNATEDLLDLMAYQKNIEDKLKPYVTIKNELVTIGKGLLMAQTYVTSSLELR